MVKGHHDLQGTAGPLFLAKKYHARGKLAPFQNYLTCEEVQKGRTT